MKQFEDMPKGEKRWMATFADLITLLLTFFVIMLGMARVDIERFQQAIKSLRKDRGITEEMENIDAGVDSLLSMNATEGEDFKEMKFSDLEHIDSEIEAKKANMEEDLVDMLEALERIVKENKLEGDVSLETSQNGIRLRVKGKLLFDVGEANIRYEALRFINSIGDALKKNQFFLLVEGHTDSSPITTDKFPSNWELSGARASSVIRYLIDVVGIEKKRLSAIGYADNYPIALNTTPAGRSLNRRVEFIFTKNPTRVVI
ncbi:OmpA family protein [candidate division KSB1 bacterium]|nr:OmpA family protein [candidate division KSB1 bacterium]